MTLNNQPSIDMKIGRYTRKTYRSRGLRKHTEQIDNDLLPSRSCVICGCTLQRKITRSGNWEDLQRFMERKTCGKIWEKDEKLKDSECLRKYKEGSTNPNYKGIMARCKICGKKLSYYKSYEEKKTEYCKKHWLEKAKKEGFFTKAGKRLLANGFSLIKGQPACGKPFQKGHKTWNKGKTGIIS